MKNAMHRMALVSMMAIVPAASFAQSGGNNNGPVTRAQVIQELIDLESVGYRPALANDATYPEDAQGAMRRLAAKRADEARLGQERQQQAPATQSAQSAQSGYGAPPAPDGEAGAPSVASGGATPPVYRHH